MTTLTSSRFSQDVVFAGAVKKLPAELKQALEEAGGLLDLGLLRAFPRSTLAGTCHGAATGFGAGVDLAAQFGYFFDGVSVYFIECCIDCGTVFGWCGRRTVWL